MKRLLIVGAGDLGREILGLLLSVSSSEWKIAGFLDDNAQSLDGYSCSYPIVGTLSSYIPLENDLFICAIAKPRTKLRICETLKSRGATFITFIHPLAFIWPGCVIGEACVLFPFSCVSNNAKLSNFVQLNAYTGVGHDAIVGAGCTLSGHCDITGKVVLGEAVFAGTHVSIIPGIEIGHDAVLGAGSVIIKKVPPYTTVMGQPAKNIGNFSVKTES